MENDYVSPFSKTDDINYLKAMFKFDDDLDTALFIGSEKVPDLASAIKLMSTETKTLLNRYYQLKSEIETTDKWRAFYKKNIEDNIKWDSDKHFFAEKVSQLTFVVIANMALHYGADHPEEIKKTTELYREIEDVCEKLSHSFAKDTIKLFEDKTDADNV